VLYRKPSQNVIARSEGPWQSLAQNEEKPSLYLRLLRGVYPEQSEGLAMTVSGLMFSTKQIESGCAFLQKQCYTNYGQK